MNRYDLCDHDEPLDLEEGLTVAARKQIPLEDFAWPEQRKYPITSQKRLDSAARLIGRAPKEERPKIKARAIAIAKRKGFQLPDSWQATESIMTESVERPQKKIATLKVCWLEYNARSLNGRIYPQATCDAIFRPAVQKIARANDPVLKGLPVTAFVSHEDANNNVNTHLVGGVTKVWQEGNKFYANIDLADTTVSRDMLALAEGGYLASESMRVLGVKLVYDENYDMPLVVPEDGYEPELMGIDLTTKPGLTDTARILAVLYESATTESQQPFIESFALSDVSIDTPKGDPMPIPIFLKVIAGTIEEAMTEDRKAHQRIHDQLAGVLDSTVAEKHGAESARYKALVESELSEEGKAIAQKHAVKIAAAHDESAKQLGMDCEGAYNEALGIALDPDQDGVPDADDPQDQDNEEESMTPEQMMEALKKQGYTIAPPKTSEQQLQESFDAKLAEQERKFNEQLAALKGAGETTQRKTQALNGGVEESSLVPEAMYESGDYLAGMLAPKNWKALADRRVPWPKDIDPKLAVHEMAGFLAYRMNMDDAHARGRDISAFIDQYEQV